MTSWLAYWFKGWLTVLLTNLCWITDWYTDSRAGRLIEQQWLTCRLAHWFKGWLTDWLTNMCWLTSWSTDLLPTRRDVLQETVLIDWLIGTCVLDEILTWLIQMVLWLTDLLVGPPSECLSVEVTPWLTVWPPNFLLSLWLDYSVCKGWILNQCFCWLCYPVND